MVTYKIRVLANGRYGIYECTDTYEILVKTFKTQKAAEGWVAKQ